MLHFLMGLCVFGGEEDGLTRPALTLLIRFGVSCSFLSFYFFPLSTGIVAEVPVKVEYLAVLSDLQILTFFSFWFV